MNLSDLELINEIKNDNEGSYRTLFFRYNKSLLFFALKFVGREIAEDILQETFLDIWKSRKNIKITKSVSGYLFSIVKNKCFKFLKIEQAKTNYKENYSLKLKEQELRFFINSEMSLLEFDTKDRIQKVISQLPQKCKEVFCENRFEGFSYQKIAEKHHISVKAVEKQISKALKLFREEFKDLLSLLIFF